MKNIFNLKKSVSLLLSLLMLLLVFTPCIGAESSWIDETLLYGDNSVTSDNMYRLVGGLTERYVVFNNANMSNQVKGYVTEVNINDSDTFVIAGYNDGDTDGWKKTTVREQTQVYEAKGYNVVAAVNGSGFNTASAASTPLSGKPWGMLAMNGVIGNPAEDRPFFAILKDGTAVIRPYNGRTDDIAEAVGGMEIVLINGEVRDMSFDTSVNPRTAVGIKADGSLVLFVADGRQQPSSCGMTYTELAHTMLALGCVDAMALDGGGSSIMLTQREASDSLEVRNTPSYANIERAVGSSLLVCTTAEPTGEFDHVSFSTDKIFCAPLTPTSFSVYGVDKYGYKTDIPDGGYLELEDDSMGSISGNSFLPGSKTGTTAINYILNGEVVASIPVEISKEADDLITQFFKKIMQAFMNIFNLMETFFQKINERI